MKEKYEQENTENNYDNKEEGRKREEIKKKERVNKENLEETYLPSSCRRIHRMGTERADVLISESGTSLRGQPVYGKKTMLFITLKDGL